MNRNQSFVAAAALTCVLALAAPATTEAGQLYRLSHEYSDTTNEISTSSATFGEFYTKTVTVPTIGDGTTPHFLFITLIGQGDVHGNTATLLRCNLDGVQPCLSNYSRTVQKLPTDEHDNSIIATWCVQAAPGTHTIKLRMATDGTTGTDVTAYMEVVSVTIDAARLNQGACVVGSGFVYELSPPI
ncbi:MAG TPA: hypothetical protein VFM29_06330 [Vicinamibacteria bacterium]|nr:hypothetical protein [Vicinamibacteria bacterium]